MIPLEHKRLLTDCSSKMELAERFQKLVPGLAPYKVHNKVSNLWTRRDQYLKDVAEADKANHRIMIPATIKTKSTPDIRADSLPDVGETLVKCQHLLAQMVQLQKEMVEVMRK